MKRCGTRAALSEGVEIGGQKERGPESSLVGVGWNGHPRGTTRERRNELVGRESRKKRGG